MKPKTLVCLSLITLVASLSPAVQAQTFSVIHAFSGEADGSYPEAGVTLRDGVLYGTFYGTQYTVGGGVYQIIRQGNDWVTTPIYRFSGLDGSNPEARVVFGPDGHLYGTTAFGGAHGKGTVFRLAPPATNTCANVLKCPFWTEDALYSFSGPDGYFVGYGDIVWDKDNNIYGTTIYGGDPFCLGNVYELQPSGHGWTGSTIACLSLPYGGLIIDNNRNLYGTASWGGIGWGYVFELTASSQNTSEHPSPLSYVFQNQEDGDEPLAGLVSDSYGNFYGSTSQGGFSNGGGGTVFELSPTGNTWTFKTLYAFPRNGGYYGCGPWGALTIDTTGNLYGATLCNGVYEQGNVFKLTNSENGWIYTSLHDFTGGSDGARPMGNVTIDADGTLYGTASEGGTSGLGTVWMIKP